MGNYRFAHQIAQFADVLAEYDHLPALDIVTLSSRQQVIVGAYPARVLGEWAKAFNRLVTVQLDFREYMVAKTSIPVQGWVLLFKENVPQLQVTGEMSPLRFLAALDSVDGAEVVAS